MKRLLSILLAALCTACTTTPPAETAAHPEWSYNAVVYEMNVRQYTPELSLIHISEPTRP